MKKILSLLSFLMLAVVAMAADLTTGVTFQGTWGDKLGNLGTAEGQMKVTKVDGGLKFEVKSNAFNGFAFPDYTIVYECEVGADGSFNVGNFSRGEIPVMLPWKVRLCLLCTGSRLRVLSPTSQSTFICATVA